MKAVQQQQIFVHLRAVLSETSACECGAPSPELAIHLYKDKAEAQAAYDFAGGFLVETTSDKLKGYIDECVYIARDVDDELEEGKAETIVGIIAGASLPYTMVTHVENKGDENEYSQALMEFSPESEEWLNTFEAATRTGVSQ